MKFYPFTTEDLDGELWREITSDYQISTFGRVKSFCQGKVIIRKPVNKRGYLVVDITINGKKKYFSIHRLVALAFIPNPSNLPQVNHQDGHKFNNYVDNLEWSTGQKNTQHAYDMGLNIASHGFEHYNAKFTNEADIIYIRENPDNLSGKALAKKFNVDPMTISYIQRGERYKAISGTVREANPKPARVPDDVRNEMSRLRAENPAKYTYRVLSEMFGYAAPTIWRIVTGK